MELNVGHVVADAFLGIVGQFFGKVRHHFGRHQPAQRGVILAAERFLYLGQQALESVEIALSQANVLARTG